MCGYSVIRIQKNSEGVQVSLTGSYRNWVLMEFAEHKHGFDYLNTSQNPVGLSINDDNDSEYFTLTWQLPAEVFDFLLLKYHTEKQGDQPIAYHCDKFN